MTKLIKFLKPYIFQLILLVAVVYVSVLTSLKLPDYMSKIVNEGIVQKNNDVVFHTGTDMLLVALLGAVCTVIVDATVDVPTVLSLTAEYALIPPLLAPIIIIGIATAITLFSLFLKIILSSPFVYYV